MATEVLIIGAGPSGLFAAAELARHGVTSRIVEREHVPHREARGTAIQPGTLEILDRAGIVEPFLDSSVHVSAGRICGPELEVLSRLSFDGVDCRYAFQCQLPQWRTEEILASHLSSFGVTVERGIEALAVEPLGDRSRVVLRHRDGTGETLELAAVIGAGGAHSITRASLGEHLEGETYAGRFLVADVKLETSVPPDEFSVVASAEGFVMLGPLPGDRFISFSDLEDDAADLTADAVADRIAVRLGGRARPSEVFWYSPFRMQRRIAPRLSDGRRFLVGDAGHLSSPFGGEGLNSGLHDAHDVAWKLALELGGRALPALVDSYPIERAAADRHVLEVSDLVHGGVISMVDALRGGQPPPTAPGDAAAAARLRDARSMIDISYAGSPIVGEWNSAANGPPEGPAPGRRYPDRAAVSAAGHHLLLFGPADSERVARIADSFDGLVEVTDTGHLDAARAGVPGGGAVLVRPDGMIGFRAVPASRDGLAALEAHLASYLIPSG